ncbi:MAG: hypothetical protein RL266_1325, partial [Bacteroidota bacterium]
MSKTEIAGWGNYPRIAAEVANPTSEKDVAALQTKLQHFIPQGAKKSYGDASLSQRVISSLSLNQTISFDVGNGIYTCQSGKMLSDVLDEIVPHGFFLPVTPGTKFITVGGAIGSDIHGKNHHKDGCFSEHLISFKIVLADGSIKGCSRTENADLFWATCGGMGLTGFITEASFKLKPITTSKILNRTIKCANLNELVDALLANQDYTYSVSWIDYITSGKNMGRSLLYLGEHSSENEVPEPKLKNFKTPKPIIGLPFNFPSWSINPLTVKAFDELYYHRVLKRDSSAIVDIEPYFYPLDAVNNWNRIYGRQGFTQYQFVIGEEHAREGLYEVMKEIVKSRTGSFIAVLKLFGEQNEGWLSFPKKGVTLTVDFGIKPEVLKLLDRLDVM